MNEWVDHLNPEEAAGRFTVALFLTFFLGRLGFPAALWAVEGVAAGFCWILLDSAGEGGSRASFPSGGSLVSQHVAGDGPALSPERLSSLWPSGQCTCLATRESGVRGPPGPLSFAIVTLTAFSVETQQVQNLRTIIIMASFMSSSHLKYISSPKKCSEKQKKNPLKKYWHTNTLESPDTRP